MRNKKRLPGSLDEAIETNFEAAERNRRPMKVMADLMGVDLKTLYRWRAESSMPLNRIRQWEAFCGASHVSEYLRMAPGNRVVIDIPSGKKAGVPELADTQANAAQAMSLLAHFYGGNGSVDETVAAMNLTLSEFAYHRENVRKTGEPELDLFQGGER